METNKLVMKISLGAAGPSAQAFAQHFVIFTDVTPISFEQLQGGGSIIVPVHQCELTKP